MQCSLPRCTHAYRCDHTTCAYNERRKPCSASQHPPEEPTQRAKDGGQQNNNGQRASVYGLRATRNMRRTMQRTAACLPLLCVLGRGFEPFRPIVPFTLCRCCYGSVTGLFAAVAAVSQDGTFSAAHNVRSVQPSTVRAFNIIRSRAACDGSDLSLAGSGPPLLFLRKFRSTPSGSICISPATGATCIA